MLYIIAVEPLGILLRNNDNIKGILLPNSETDTLIFQHADDTTLTVADKRSVECAFNTCKLFCDATGAEVNMTKSEVLPLGNSANCNCTFDCNVNVVKGCVNILGVHLGTDKELCEEKNWREKINSIKSIINLWKQRNLTLKGKATVVANLLLSKLYYNLHVVTIPDWALKEIKVAIVHFIWKDKPSAIAYQSIIGSFNEGGLNIPDVYLKMLSFRLKFIRRFLDNNYKAAWKYTMQYYLQKYGDYNMSSELFHTIIVKGDLQELPIFYKEMLIAWQELCKNERQCPITYRDILEQPICRNPLITFNGKMLDLSMFVKSGITKIRDILYEYVPGYLPVKAVQEIIIDRFPDADRIHIRNVYNIIRVSIPLDWDERLLCVENTDKTVSLLRVCSNGKILLMQSCTTSTFYKLLLKQVFKEPKGEAYWKQHYPDLKFPNIWKIVNINIKPAVFIDIDYKVVCNIVFTMEKLARMKIVSSPLCTVCNDSVEDMLHMFVHCEELHDLKLLISSLIEVIFAKADGALLNSVSLEQMLLFGYCCTHKGVNTILLNFLLSVYRYIVFRRRQLNIDKIVNINIVRLFKHTFRTYLRYMYHHYKSNRNLPKFRHTLLTNNHIVLERNNEISVNF